MKLSRTVENWIPKESSIVAPSDGIDKKSEAGSCAKMSGFDADAAKTYARLFRQVASIPLVKTGSILPSRSEVSVVLEHADLENNDRVQWNHRLKLSGNGDTTADDNLPTYPLGKRLTFTSPSKKITMTVVPLAAPGGAATESADIKIEFSDPHGITHSFTNVKKVHKGLAADALFQNIHWSSDETEVYYVAECLPKTASKFWEDGSPKPTDGDGTKAPFEAKDTWGERVPDLSTLSLFKINLKDVSIKRVLGKKFAESYSCAMPVVLEKQKCILFGAFPHYPLRLGVAAYNARRNKMFKVPLVEEAEVEPEDISSTFLHQGNINSVCAMRVNPHNPNLIAVVHALNTDIHGSGCDLSILRADTMKLTPCVVTPKTGSPTDPVKDFPGLYPFGGSTDLNWVNDQFLLLGSIRRSSYVIYSVDATATGSFSLLSSTFGAWRVLDVYQGKVLATMSAATQPPKVLLLDLADSSTSTSKVSGTPNWRVLFDAASPISRPQLHSIASGFSTEVVPFPLEGNSEVLIHTSAGKGDKVSEFLSHLDGRRSGSTSSTATKTKTIGFVHGGPHATDVNAFSYGQFFALCCGYEIVSVNYEGSLGFGQQHAEALPGHCGTKDVQCVMSAFTKLGRTDKDKYDLFIAGGSHGGFLSCHLTGQYPTTFRATAMRNPVTNLNAMLDTTDIPDWVVVEAGILSLAGPTMTPEEQGRARLGGSWDRNPQILHDASPIKYVNAVQCPTLVGIGLNDMRVPTSQGKGWYRALKRNQEGRSAEDPHWCRDARLLEYPGTGHGMDSVHADADFHIHQMLFFDAQL